MIDCNAGSSFGAFAKYSSAKSKTGAANSRPGSQQDAREGLAPRASTIAVVVDPAVAMARVPHQIRAANYGADHSADGRADRSSNDGTRAGADSGAFQSSGLGRDGHGRQRQHEHSSLEHRAHDKSPW
jgi:hypothetical protein